MIAVASIVVHFFEVEQRMVSKNNLVIVEGRTTQIADTDEFFEASYGMGLSPTPKTFRCLQDPHLPDTAGWLLAPHSLVQSMNLPTKRKHLVLPLAVRLPHLQLAVLWPFQ